MALPYLSLFLHSQFVRIGGHDNWTYQNLLSPFVIKFPLGFENDFAIAGGVFGFNVAWSCGFVEADFQVGIYWGWFGRLSGLLVVQVCFLGPWRCPEVEYLDSDKSDDPRSSLPEIFYFFLVDVTSRSFVREVAFSWS